MKKPLEYMIEQRDRLTAWAKKKREHEKIAKGELAQLTLEAETAEAEAKALTDLINLLTPSDAAAADETNGASHAFSSK